MREIHRARNAKSPVPHDLLQDFVAALPAPVRRQHRIQRHRAVVMKADPVIGENGIRLGGLLAVGRDEHFARRRAPGPSASAWNSWNARVL